jgi:hypothetical protein
MPEKRIVDQAFFYHESNIAMRLNQAGQDKGFQNAHVIRDEDARRFGFMVRGQIFDFEPAAHGFERFYRI